MDFQQGALSGGWLLQDAPSITRAGLSPVLPTPAACCNARTALITVPPFVVPAKHEYTSLSVFFTTNCPDHAVQNYAAMKQAMDAALLPANVAGWSDGARYWAISMMQAAWAGRGGGGASGCRHDAWGRQHSSRACLPLATTDGRYELGAPGSHPAGAWPTAPLTRLPCAAAGVRQTWATTSLASPPTLRSAQVGARGRALQTAARWDAQPRSTARWVRSRDVRSSQPTVMVGAAQAALTLGRPYTPARGAQGRS